MDNWDNETQPGHGRPADEAPDHATDSKVREMERDSLFMQGQLHAPGLDQPVTVRVRNLSAGGMMADYSGNLAEDGRVEIELRNVGLISGHVAWVSASQFGMAFDAPIDPHAVRRPIGVKRDDLFRPVTLGKYDNYKRHL